MKRVYLLNLDNDGALACRAVLYTPPAQALQLEHDLELLPLWWAEDGDYIITPNHSDADIAALCDRIGVKVTRYQGEPDVAPAPWGWSRHAATTFKRMGVSPELIPDQLHLHRLKTLSHRSTAIRINDMLRDRYGYAIPNEPTLVESVRRFADIYDHGNELILKRPWSSSGRGIFPLNTLSASEALRLAKGIIARQGAVIAEKLLDKLLDFSALYCCSEGKVEFRSWSVFHASTSGRYEGNFIDTSDVLLSTIPYPADKLTALATHLQQILSEIIGTDYNGWVGVDMLLYGPDMQLAPCIEMNLRMTMGVVAHMLSRFPSYRGKILKVVDASQTQEPLASGRRYAITALDFVK